MLAKRKIIDATLELIRAGGFSSISIVAVARKAGVSRQTVYSLFESKDDIVSQAVGGVALGVFGDISSRVMQLEAPLDQIVELVVAARNALRDNEILSILVARSESNPIYEPDTVIRAIPIVTTLLAPVFAKNPALSSREDDIVELTVRLGLSVIMYDSPVVHDDDGLRRFIAAPLGALTAMS